MRGRSSLVKGHVGMNNCIGWRVQFPVTKAYVNSENSLRSGIQYTLRSLNMNPSPSQNPMQTETRDFFYEPVTGRLVHLISIHLRIPGYLEITHLKKKQKTSVSLNGNFHCKFCCSFLWFRRTTAVCVCLDFKVYLSTEKHYFE